MAISALITVYQAVRFVTDTVYLYTSEIETQRVLLEELITKIEKQLGLDTK